jgi:hypothetical protein
MDISLVVFAPVSSGGGLLLQVLEIVTLDAWLPDGISDAWLPKLLVI